METIVPLFASQAVLLIHSAHVGVSRRGGGGLGLEDHYTAQAGGPGLPQILGLRPQIYAPAGASPLSRVPSGYSTETYKEGGS